MNKNDYRRALVMLRGQKTGISGYVRLERRTLIGSLQFTINGVQSGSELAAALLWRKNGIWNAIRLDQFAATRSGQAGLVLKFDPRNIEGRTFEQYELAAVAEEQAGTFDLLMCGCINGTTEVDWSAVRTAVCRLFSPVRISEIPIPPIDERKTASAAAIPSAMPDTAIRQSAMPEGNEALAAGGQTIDGEAEHRAEFLCGTASNDASPDIMTDCSPDVSSIEETGPITENPPEGVGDVQEDEHLTEYQTKSHENAKQNLLSEAEQPSDGQISGEQTLKTDITGSCTPVEIPSVPDDADGSAAETDDIDTPARTYIDDLLDIPAEEKDELDVPAAQAASLSDDMVFFNASNETVVGSSATAGDLLNLDNPSEKWPESIEELRALFFSSEAVRPFFHADGFVFIRVPLPEGATAASCLCGIQCDNGLPAKVCYAIPAQYTAEPPAGLEDYTWIGDHLRGYWTITNTV